MAAGGSQGRSVPVRGDISNHTNPEFVGIFQVHGPAAQVVGVLGQYDIGGSAGHGLPTQGSVRGGISVQPDHC